MRIFKADDDIAACYRYADHHQIMLARYGVGHVTSNAADWMYHGATYVLMCESLDGSLVYGGGRIQLKSAGNFLPVERALSDYEGRIVRCIPDKKANVAELCGVWFNKKGAGYGLACLQLIRYAVAVAPELGVDLMLGFCSPYTVRTVLNTGAVIVDEIGDNGQFFYPNKETLSTLIVYNDLQRLPAAAESDRRQIHFLRTNNYEPVAIAGNEGEAWIYCQVQKTTRQSIVASGMVAG